MTKRQDFGGVRTTCPYCGVGCGVLASAHPGGESGNIAGDPDHPANFGRLCSKGAALGETLSLDGRLLHPLVHGERASWDATLDLVAARFSQAIATHGADSVAFYVSGQLLTEDYYVANKLMKGFIGSANIDTNSRLCMASSVAGHKRAFGSDTVPGAYEDLEHADLVALVGSNLAWCHPVLFQRLAAAKEARGTKVVVIDPRGTATCEIADLHLALASGSDVALFNGLLAHLERMGRLDRDYIRDHTSGFEAALAAARASGVAAVSGLTGLDGRDIETFYGLFAGTERAVTVFSQGVNQSTAGTDKVNAIINCHLATGRIGKPGMGPFSVTGQPNAMGGREVGGLANMLACHMELGDPEHRRIARSFWTSPTIADKPGLKAVDLFRAVGDGRVKALWIMATNPAASLPEADAARAALAQCPFVVVSDVVRHTDTTAHAHVLLPSAAWGEKDGAVTNSERRVSRQRAFLPLPGEAKPDWWQVAEVGKRMGFVKAFSYSGPSEIFAEYARLSGAENEGKRDFDISAYGNISRDDYDALTPFQWPRPAGSQPHITRFFGAGGFFTADRRARFVPTPFRAPASTASVAFPFVLNTGRIRDQWHTMTRTGKTPRLLSHVSEPCIELHPDDASRLGLDDADLAEVANPHGRFVARVTLSARQRAGSVFAPIHWTDQFASRARVGALIPAATDPISGQPELKSAAVAVRRFDARWRGFAVTRARPRIFGTDYWVLAPARGGWRLELGGFDPPRDATAYARALFGLTDERAAEVIAYHDAAGGQHRVALFVADRLAGALFLAAGPVTASRALASEYLSQPVSSRLAILAGRAGAVQRDRGEVVCSCFEVGFNEIAEAVASGGGASVASVGHLLKAGTNCGSCRDEIARIVRDRGVAKAGSRDIHEQRPSSSRR